MESVKPPPADDEATLTGKLRRGELLDAACPSREVLKHVTSRWGVLVLLVLATGVHRFSGLRRAIGGVSERMLAQTLQWLEGDGLVDRIAFDVVPPHVEYRLTPLGREAAERVQGLADWIETRLPQVLQAREGPRAPMVARVDRAGEARPKVRPRAMP